MRIVWKAHYTIHHRRRRILFRTMRGVCIMYEYFTEKLQNLINSTESYLKTESSKTYDSESYKNHLRGEVSGYKIALDLIKAAK